MKLALTRDLFCSVGKNFDFTPTNFWMKNEIMQFYEAILKKKNEIF